MSYNDKLPPSGRPWEGYYFSSYGIAVKHGYNGTEEEWIAEQQQAVSDAADAKAAATAAADDASDAKTAATEAQTAAESAEAKKPLFVTWSNGLAKNIFNSVNDAYLDGRPVYMKYTSGSNTYIIPLVKRYYTSSNYCRYYFAAAVSGDSIVSVTVAKTSSTSYSIENPEFTSIIQNPTLPSEAGTFTLKATKTSAAATPTYSWVKDE